MKDHLSREELTAFLTPFSPGAQQIALATRDLLLDLFPDAIETAEGRELGYGFDRGYKGLVFTISLKKSGVNLGVVGGASLVDPDGLLRGTGKLHRHVEILESHAVEDPRLRALLGRALTGRRSK
jgi:hypothetical protein